MDNEGSQEYLKAAVEQILDQGLQAGKLKKGEHQTILEYLEDGEEVPEALLNLLQASDRSIIVAAAAAGQKAVRRDVEEKLHGSLLCVKAGENASVLNMPEASAASRGTDDEGKELADSPLIISGSTRNNAVKLPYDNIFIFHDAENCPLPKKTIKRNAAGAKVMVDGRVQFLDSHPHGLGDICFADVYAGIIKTTLRCALVGGGADPGQVDKLLESVDVNKHLQVTYHFLFSGEISNPFYPVNSVLTGMHTKGVNVLTADRKKGSVDVKITDLMNTELDKTRNYTEEGLAKTLFVLISGDRDFAHTVKRVRQGRIEVVLITSTDCPANRDFLSILSGPAWTANNWLEIVENSQRHAISGASNSGKFSPERKATSSFSRHFEALPSSLEKPSATALAVDDNTLVCSVAIESLSKAWFAKKYGLARLNESVCSLDVNLKVEVEARKEFGLKVRVLWVQGDDKTDSASLCQISKDAVIAAVETVLSNIESHGPVILPGVSPASLKWQSPEGKEFSTMQRSLGVSLFVSQQQSSPDANVLKDNELIVEHPSDWDYHKLWQYCAIKVGVTMDTTYRPEPDEELQKGVRSGKRRSRVRIFGKFGKLGDLEDKKRKCYTHQVPDCSVLFVVTSKEAKAFVVKAPKQASTAAMTTLPSVEGWQVCSYNNEAASVTLTFFKGEEAKMKDMLQLLSLRTKVVAKCAVNGAAQVLLVQRQFASLQGQLELCGITPSDITMNWPVFPNLRGKVETAKDIPPVIASELTLTGRPECVEKAMRLWNVKISTMQVQSVSIPIKKASQFGLVGELMWNIKKSLLAGRRQKETSNAEGKADEEEDDGEDDDDDSSTTESTTSSVADVPLSIGLYRSFPLEKGGKLLKPRACVDVAFFLAEDASEAEYVKSVVDEVVDALSSVVENYRDETCAFDKVRAGMLKIIPATQKRYLAEFRKMGVSGCYFDYKKNSLVLSGNSSAVEDALKWLTEIPDDHKVVGGHVFVPSKEIGRVLQQSPAGKQFLNNLAQNHSNRAKQVLVRVPVTAIEKQKGFDAVLVVKAPKSLLSSIVQEVEAELRAWLACNFAEEQFLPEASRAQANYLQSEDGAKLLRSIGWHHGVYIKTPQRTQVDSVPHTANPPQFRNVVQDSFALGSDLTCSVVKGNMLRECCVAFVNAANEHLMHSGGLARAIADAAGQAMIDQGNAARGMKYPGGVVPVGQCVVTGSHGLKDKKNPVVDYVIHAVGPRCDAGGSVLERLRYTNTVWSALSCAANLNVESLAFPLMGSGIYRWPVPLAAELLVEAVLSWVAKHGVTCIKRIVLIDNKDDCVAAMQAELHKWVRKGSVAASAFFPSSQPSETKFSMPRPRYFWSWFKHETNQWIAYDYDQVLQIERAFLRESQSAVTLRGDVHGVVSDSKHIPEGERSAVYNVSRCAFNCPHTRKLYDYFQSNIKSGYRRPVHYEAFEPKKHKMFGYEEVASTPDYTTTKLAVAMSTCLLPSLQVLHSQCGESNADAHVPVVATKKQSSFTAVGPRDDISKAQIAVLVALRKAGVESKDMDWADTAPGNWLDVVLSLDQALQTAGLQDVEIVHAAGVRVIKLCCIGETLLAKAMQVALELKTSMLTQKLKREAAIAWPEEWDDKDECDPSQPGCRFLELQQGSPEWNFVESEWRGSPSINGQPRSPRSAFLKNIARIQRVQNPSAWAAYYNRVKLLAAKNTTRGADESVFAKANEHWMKHGTRTMDPTIIAKGDSGLDYRYCDAGLFGRAAYTADDAQYSDSYRYTLPDGKAQMFLVRVAAGNIFEVSVRTEAHKGLRTPPEGHHSIRGPVTETHKAIMVYQTDQAYPAYLITYEK
ncbi:NYN domain-containing protein [archaeon]|nr:MAG: NYN domain-containing protein [archaeon]